MSKNHSFKELAENVMNGIKDELKKQIREKAPGLGGYLSTEISGGLAENSKEVVEAFKAMIEKLRYQRDFDIISEEEYYRKLEALRDRYFSAGSENWVKYTEEIYSYQKKTLEQEAETIIGLYDEVSDYAEQRIDEVVKKQQKAAEKLYGTGQLFKVNTVNINGKKDVYYSLGDLEQDIELIRRYGSALDSLKNRAQQLEISDSVMENIFAEIKNSDIDDGYNFMRALLNAEDKDFAQFAAALQVKKDLSQTVSAQQYESEFAAGTEAALANMKAKLEQAGYEIPDGFVVSGSISAQKFGEAFVNELDTQLDAIKTRIEEFNVSLSAEVVQTSGGNTYNTTNTSYNISSRGDADTVEQIKRYETVKRLAGLG